MAKQNELLLDTSALIDMYRGSNLIKPYFDFILDDSLLPYVSVVTIAELWRGLRSEELERHELLMERFVSVPFDADMARLAGAWMQKYANSGLGWMDALISATGKVAGLKVLTRDKKLAAVLISELTFETYGL